MESRTRRRLVAVVVVAVTFGVVALLVRAVRQADEAMAWAPVQPMPEPRFGHGVALLSDGRVLVAGGYNESPAAQPLASSALYDPVANAWEPAGELGTARQGPLLLPLDDGGAVIIGGAVPGEAYHEALDSVERFDPRTNAWLPVPSMTTPRKGAAAVRLLDGRILVIGGANGPPDGTRFLASAEIFDPSDDSWTPTAGNLNVARDLHQAVLLRDGRVLVVGGEGPWRVETLVSELYDPEADAFVVAGNTNVPRYNASTLGLRDGRVLVTGGWNPQGGQSSPEMHTSTEIYDPARGTWEMGPSLEIGRRQHASLLLPNGDVMVAGGTTTGEDALTSTEVLHVADGTWRPGPSLPVGTFSRHAAPVSLADQSVLLTGGYGVGEEEETLEVLAESQMLRRP